MYGEAAPGEDSNVFYYLTVYNEPMPQPAKPAGLGIDEGIVKGLYRFNTAESAGLSPSPTPRASSCWAPARRSTGPSRRRSCSPRWGVAADVWSATSWTELRRDALEADAALLRGEERMPFVRQALHGAEGPVLAVSDYMRQVPDQIAQWVEQDYSSLGADGFGLRHP